MAFKKYFCTVMAVVVFAPMLAFAQELLVIPNPVKDETTGVWYIYELDPKTKTEFIPRLATDVEAAELNKTLPCPSPALGVRKPPPNLPRFRTPDITNPASIVAQNKALADLKKVGPGAITIGGIKTDILTIKHRNYADAWEVALFGRDMNRIPATAITRPHPGGPWEDINKNILQFEGPFVMPPQQAPAEPGSAALGGSQKAGGQSAADWQNWFNSFGSATFQINLDLARWGHWPVLNLQVANPTLFGFALNFNAPPPATIKTDVWRQRHGRIAFGIPGADLFVQFSDLNGDGSVDTYRFYKINPDGVLGKELTSEEFAQYGLNMGYWNTRSFPTSKVVLNTSQEPPILIASCYAQRDGSYACYGLDGKFVASAVSKEAKDIIDAHKGPLMFYPGAKTGFGFVPMPSLPPKPVIDPKK